MINYIKAELYKSFNRLYFWLYTACIGIFAILPNVIIFSMKDSTAIEQINSIFDVLFMVSLIAPVYLVVGFIDIITSDENKNETLRNVVVFGVPRSKIVLSKLIATVILSIIAEFIVLVLFLGSAFILVGINSELLIIITSFLQKVLVATPLWIATVAIGTCLTFIIKNNNIFAFVYAGIFLLGDKVIKLLTIFVSDNFKYIENILITKKISEIGMEGLTNSTIISSVLMGVIYTIVFTVITILYFRKKEVK